MDPKNKGSTFFYSNLKKPSKIELFNKKPKQIDENKDICDQISYFLDEDCQSKKSNYKFKKEETIQLKVENESLCSENISFSYKSCNNKTVLSDIKPNVEMKINEIKIVENKPEENKKVLEDKTNCNSKDFKFVLPDFKPFKFEEENKSNEVKLFENKIEYKTQTELSEIPFLIQKLINENNELKLKKNSSEAEKNSIELKNEVLINELETIKKEKSFFECKFNELKNEYTKLKKEISINELEKEKIEKYLDLIKKEIQELKILRESDCNKIKLLNDEKREIENKILNYEKNAVFSYKKMNELEEKIKQQQNCLENLEIENSDYKNQLEEKKMKIENLKKEFKSEKEKTENLILKLKNEKEKINHKLNLKCSENEILKKENICKLEIFEEEIKEKINKIKDKLTGLRGNICEVKIHLEEINEKTNIKKNLIKILEKIKPKINIFSCTIKKLKEKKKNLLNDTMIMKNSLQEIYYFYLKEKTEFSYLIEDLQVRHRNEVTNIKNIYSSQIKKIIKHYKGKMSDVKKLIPKDDDMWSVLK
ncbi:hypothetical protein TUBRATIS_006080 [Tubulinosema ratisbonensis]|uniref:Uncharacterized protein n=1 Tax=Tubulinosema ratisbonensis TaxID=291195 RepID=A0A437AP14_9MICR|nr:hypothetical protein TUBRATIS_006080 [Tubulinosema ratisbonensis]